MDIRRRQKDFADLGHSGLAAAITKYHGGFHEFKKLLGEDVKEMPDWKNLNYTIKQARMFMKEHGFGTLPSANKLEMSLRLTPGALWLKARQKD